MEAGKIPNLEDHLQLASSENTDYLVKADKSIDYKVEIAKQFIAAYSGEIFGFPNSSFHIQPFIIEIRGKNMLTQLKMQTNSAEEIDELQEKVNVLFKQS